MGKRKDLVRLAVTVHTLLLRQPHQQSMLCGTGQTLLLYPSDFLKIHQVSLKPHHVFLNLHHVLVS